MGLEMLERSSDALTGCRFIVATPREMIGANLRHALKREGGADDVAIKSGPEALSLINDGYKPDAVICDFHLDLITGPQMVNFLNQEKQWTPIPKVMFVHENDQDAIQASLRCGVKGIILFPFTVATAIKVVKRAIGR